MSIQETRPLSRRRPEQTRRVVVLVVGLVALGLLIWFMVANSQRVTVDWFSVDTTTPLFVVIFVAGVLGALIGRAVQWLQQRRR